MICQTTFALRSHSLSSSKPNPQHHARPFSTLTNTTNTMDYDATPMTGAGPSSYNYADFHPLDYPQNNLSLDESFTIAIDHDYGCNIITPQSSSSSNFSGIFDPAFFDHNSPDFFHPDTPSSASSSNSEVPTPVSDRGEIQSPVIECRVAEGSDIDMEPSFGGEVAYGDDAIHIPLDFRDPLLTMFKSASDDLPDDWPQLLATLCDQHPEAVKWFTETGGFLPGFDPISAPQNEHEHDYLMQQHSSPIYPHQHSDTLSDFLSSFGDSSSLSPSASRSLSSSTQIPLHQPQPVRPIPQIPLKDLAAAAAALRLARPRGPREAHQTLSPLSLLCQPVDDSVRYQLGSQREC